MADSSSSLDAPQSCGADRRPWVARWVVAGALIVSSGWIVLTGWLALRGASWSDGMLMASIVVGLSVVVTAVMALVSRAPASPMFEVRVGVGFVVPTNARFGYLVATHVILVGLVTGHAFRQWSGPIVVGVSRGVADHVVAVILSVSSIALAVLVAHMVAGVFTGRPFAVLTPRALVLYEVLGSRAVPWEAMRAGAASSIRNQRMLMLAVDCPEVVTRRGLTRATAQVPLDNACVHRQFLADAVRYFVDRPDRRDAIGTVAGYALLRTEVGLAP